MSEQSFALLATLNSENAGSANPLVGPMATFASDTENLKQARSDMLSGSVDVAAQLKASQAQMAGISQQLKATQERMARPGATEQQPRPSVGTSRSKSEPTPASRQVRVRPEHALPVQQPNQR